MAVHLHKFTKYQTVIHIFMVCKLYLNKYEKKFKNILWEEIVDNLSNFEFGKLFLKHNRKSMNRNHESINKLYYISTML